ncbi:semaphorin-3F-like isoform X1 [Labeo rohita]|uniref:Semaphorin-3F-like isoform X1 n=1 Tax=Labeo rohita TaxID=84645 RepID=A0A498NQY0_LABRO|nr:semaphorin-3F-like isoform X1 [Labeo rohita]
MKTCECSSDLFSCVFLTSDNGCTMLLNSPWSVQVLLALSVLTLGSDSEPQNAPRVFLSFKVTRHCVLFEWVAIVMEEDELSSALIEAMPGPPSPPLTLHPRSTPLPGGNWVEAWLCEEIKFLKFPVDCGIGQESGAYCSPWDGM